MTYYTGEIFEFQTTFERLDHVQSIWFVVYILISGVMGIVITLSVLMLITINGPISQSIVGNMKDVVLTWIGFMFFDDATLTSLVFCGLALSFLGAALYAFDQYQRFSAQKKPPAK